MVKSFFNFDDIKNYFSDHKKEFLFSIMACVLGLLVAVLISFSDYDYLSLLNDSDKVLYDYIIGDIDKLNIFFSKLKTACLFLIILFVFNISFYSVFLSYIFIGYQFMLFTLTIVAIISLQGFSGIMVVCFLLLPINILMFFIISIYNSLLTKRAFIAHKLKLSFGKSFLENNLYLYLIIMVLIVIVVCFVYGFILPLFVKNLVFVVY